MAADTLTALERLLKQRFGGLLKKGKHTENGECCALELLSVLRGLPWTDSNDDVRSWDLRPLNDVDVSDECRTKHLLPVVAAYDGSLDWSNEQQQAVATRIAIGTVNVLIAELPDLPAEIAKACREAKTREEAAEASRAARAASRAAWSARSAAWSAWSARSASRAARAASRAAWSAWSARSAAWARSAAARERVLIAACQVWLDAVKS